MGLHRSSARGVGHEEHIKAIRQSMNRSHSQANLGVKSGQHELLAASLPYGFDEVFVLPTIDQSTIYRPLLREDILDPLDQITATILKDSAQDGWYAEELR